MEDCPHINLFDSCPHAKSVKFDSLPNKVDKELLVQFQWLLLHVNFRKLMKYIRHIIIHIS